jgi:hypothetical protein
LEAGERRISELKASFSRQTEAVEASVPVLKFHRREFKITSHSKIFKVSVVGFFEDSERLLRLIEFCEKDESIHSNVF